MATARNPFAALLQAQNPKITQMQQTVMTINFMAQKALQSTELDENQINFYTLSTKVAQYVLSDINSFGPKDNRFSDEELDAALKCITQMYQIVGNRLQKNSIPEEVSQELTDAIQHYESLRSKDHSLFSAKTTESLSQFCFGCVMPIVTLAASSYLLAPEPESCLFTACFLALFYRKAPIIDTARFARDNEFIRNAHKVEQGKNVIQALNVFSQFANKAAAPAYIGEEQKLEAHDEASENAQNLLMKKNN